MTLDTLASLAQIISVIILLPIAIWKIWRKLDERLTAQDKRLIAIEAQFYRNGGSSMKDDIICIKTDLSKLTGRFEQHIEEGTD